MRQARASFGGMAMLQVRRSIVTERLHVARPKGVDLVEGTAVVEKRRLGLLPAAKGILDRDSLYVGESLEILGISVFRLGRPVVVLRRDLLGTA